MRGQNSQTSNSEHITSASDRNLNIVLECFHCRKYILDISFKLCSLLLVPCYLASMSSIRALGLSKPDVMRLDLYDPSNRETSILLV